MAGAFGTTSVAVTGSLDTNPFLTGPRKIWVRGRDAAGNWGAASALTVLVNGPEPVAVGGVPAVAFLAQNAPNPFANGTSIHFGLPAPGRVDLAVYDVQGRLLKRLVSGPLDAGEHTSLWDGTDEHGSHVRPGVYYYRLVLPDHGRFEKRMVSLQ